MKKFTLLTGTVLLVSTLLGCASPNYKVLDIIRQVTTINLAFIINHLITGNLNTIADIINAQI